MGYGRDERKHRGDKAVDAWVVVRGVVVVQPWRAFRIKSFLDLRVSDTANNSHQCKQSKVDDTKHE